MLLSNYDKRQIAQMRPWWRVLPNTCPPRVESVGIIWWAYVMRGQRIVYIR